MIVSGIDPLSSSEITLTASPAMKISSLGNLTDALSFLSNWFSLRRYIVSVFSPYLFVETIESTVLSFHFTSFPISATQTSRGVKPAFSTAFFTASISMCRPSLGKSKSVPSLMLMVDFSTVRIARIRFSKP